MFNQILMPKSTFLTYSNLSLCFPGLERDVVRLRVRRPPSPVRPTADPRTEPSRATLRGDGPRCSAARRLRQTRQRQPVRTRHQLTGSLNVFMLGIILYSFYYFRFRYHLVFVLRFHVRYHLVFVLLFSCKVSFYHFIWYHQIRYH
jgi:hypothetical protein